MSDKASRTIRLLKPSIDDAYDPPVLRGVLDPASLACLRVDHTYQREKLTASARREITRAIETGAKLPDIELGMRGDTFTMTDNSALFLVDPVYIIDGYQRVSSLQEHHERFPEDRVRLGTVVHLNTDLKFERDRFQALNLFRQRVSPSVLLRNVKEENDAIATLYGLSMTNPDFALHHKVCWQQTMSAAHLITGLTLAQVTLILHQHLGHLRRESVREIPEASLRLRQFTGLPLLRNNVATFWEMLDHCFGVRDLARRDPATHLRISFLRVLSRVLSDHTDFWAHPDEKRLLIPDHIRRKLRSLPIHDPEIVRLAGASGKAADTLYFQMVRHINSGKRTKRLTHRHGEMAPLGVFNGADDEELAEA